MYHFLTGIIFILFFQAFCYAQKTVFKHYHRGNGLASDYVNSIFQDSKGYIWISSDKGASRYDGKDFRHFNTDNGLAGNMVYEIWEDTNGLIWFDVYEKPLCYWDGKKMNISNILRADFKYPIPHQRAIGMKAIRKHPIVHVVQEFDTLKKVEADTLLDYEGNQWASIFGKGVYKYVPHLKYWNVGDEIVNFYKDKSQKSYLIGRKGIYIFDKNRLAQTILLSDARALAEGKSGKFFIGSLYDWFPNTSLTQLPKGEHCSGISDIISYQNHFWISTFGVGVLVQNATQKDTLNIKNKNLVSNTIERLLKTPHYFWATTYGNGVSRIDPKTRNVVNYDQKIGLLSNSTYYVYEQNAETFWIASEGGISIFRNQELFQNMASPEKILAIVEHNGLMYAISEKNLYKIKNFQLKKLGSAILLPPDVSAGINRVFVEKNWVYIAHTEGVSVLDLDKIPQNNPKPKLQIQEISSKKNFLEFSNISLAHNDNQLRFKIAALSFLNESENQISYRIKERESGWSEPQRLKEIILEDLDYQNYTLELKVYNANLTASEVVYLPFQVIAPYWRETWFVASMGFVGLVLFTFLVRYISYRRLRNKLKNLELQQKIQKERERIARDLHDNVGSQLTYIIANLEYTAENLEEKTKNQLEELSDYTRQTINQLRETIWAINQPTITLESFESKTRDLIWNYTKRFKEPKISTHIHLEQNITLNSVQALNLYRILQEALNNAFKHSKAQEIMVKIQTIHGFLKMSIKDNGVGFDTFQDHVGQHYGLTSLETRAQEIGAILNIQSEPNQGTNISLELKLNTSKQS